MLAKMAALCVINLKGLRLAVPGRVADERFDEHTDGIIIDRRPLVSSGTAYVNRCLER
jgi:hypothetical protein